MLIENHQAVDFAELNRRIEQSNKEHNLKSLLGEPEKLSLSELLSLQDEDFINAAFEQLLRREVDPVGRDIYLNLLRSGTPKVFILASLRYSFEGNQIPDPMMGLRKFFWLQKASKIPRLGRLVAFSASLFNTVHFQHSTAANLNNQYRDNLVTQRQLQDQITALQNSQKKLSIQLMLLDSKHNEELKLLKVKIEKLSTDNSES